MASPVASSRRGYQFPTLSAPNSPASVATSNYCKPEQQQLHILEPLTLPPASAAATHVDQTLSLEASYQDLQVRIGRLRTFVEKKNSNTELLRACQETLRSRIPMVMHQSHQMIQDETTERFVNDVRSTFALYRAIQYVDRLQEAMDPTTNEGIEEQLERVISVMKKPPPAFRLSPWVATDLCFDVPIGASAKHTIPGVVCVELEPIVEFRAHDAPSVNYARAAAATPVSVSIESCKHVKRTFGLGSGKIGQATITVRLEPLDDEAANGPQVWGLDKPVPALQIKEARAYVDR